MTTDSAYNPEGTVEELDKGFVLRFERKLAHAPERVWRALTDPQELRGWFGDARIVDLTVGGRFLLNFLVGDEEGNTFALDATVTEVDPPRVLEYRDAQHGVLRWDVRPEGGGSVLAFSSTTDASRDLVPKLQAGWHVHMGLLARTLDDAPLTDWAAFPQDEYGRALAHYERALS